MADSSVIYVVAATSVPGVGFTPMIFLVSSKASQIVLPPKVNFPIGTMLLTLSPAYAFDILQALPEETRGLVFKIQATLATEASSGFQAVSDQVSHPFPLLENQVTLAPQGVGSNVFTDSFVGKTYRVIKNNLDVSSILPTVLLRRLVPDRILAMASHQYPIYAKVNDVTMALLRELELHQTTAAFTISCSAAPAVNPSQVTDRVTINAYRDLERFPRPTLLGLLRRLLTDGFATNPKTGQFSTVDSLSLPTFLVNPPYGSELRRDHLEEALRNFQRVLELLGGSAFTDVFSEVRDKILCYEWDTARWTPQYIRYIIEHQLYAAFHLLRTVDFETILATHGHMTHDQSSVARFIKYFLSLASPSVDHKAMFEQVGYATWGGCMGSPHTVPGRRVAGGRYAAPAALAAPATSSPGLTEEAPTPSADQRLPPGHCVYNLAQLLDLPEKCERSNCRHKHLTPEAFRNLPPGEFKMIVDGLAALRRPSDKELLIARSLISRMRSAAIKKGLLPKFKKPVATETTDGNGM
jgi:hypothetical protein